MLRKVGRRKPPFFVGNNKMVDDYYFGEQTLLNENVDMSVDEKQTKRPDDSLFFDGQKLRWYRDNQLYREWDAMAGQAAYQARQYQNKVDGGPLPYGDYNVRQDKLQHRQKSIFDVINNYNPRGKWPGGEKSWGNHRVWLEPDKHTNTRNRNNFSIHGGKEMNSRGCIDLASEMDDFSQEFQGYGRDMLLRVRYPKEKW